MFKTTEKCASEAAHSWVNGRFIMRSGYYAGRAPSTGDLNSDILEMFYQGIKRDVDKEEAAWFVRFVNKLQDLSASAFIVAFEHFWASGCTMSSISQCPEDRRRLSAHGAGLQAEAFGLIGEMMFGRPMSEEDIIVASLPVKSTFISRHAKEIPTNERHEEASKLSRRIHGSVWR
jgi:hypothetical protein